MKTFTDTETNRLKQVVAEGVQVLGDVQTLKDGLKETVKSIAEDLDIAPATLNRAIRIAFKADFKNKQDEFSEVEEILRATGRDY